MKKLIFKDIYNNIEYKIYFNRLYNEHCYYNIEIYKSESQFMNYIIIDNEIIKFKNNCKKMRKLCYQFYLRNREYFEFYINNLKNS